MKKILVVEDDKNIVELMDIHLRDMNCELVKAYDGMDGLTKAQKSKFDLIILDIMLPRLDGLEVCRQIRASKINTPIMMLTARSEEIDKVLGLEIGADDYMTKPFGIREFLARVKAILRRNELLQQNSSSDSKAVLEYGSLIVDIEKRKVTLSLIHI